MGLTLGQTLENLFDTMDKGLDIYGKYKELNQDVIADIEADIQPTTVIVQSPEAPITQSDKAVVKYAMVGGGVLLILMGGMFVAFLMRK